MQIETISQSFRLARSVNQTSSSYVAKIPTNAEPMGDAGTATGSSVIEVGGGGVVTPGGVAQNLVFLVPFGTGSNAQTLSVQVWGWRKVGNVPSSLLWVPTLLAEITCSLSSGCPGVAGTLIPATMLFSNIITVVNGAPVVVSSGQAGVIASALVDMKGSQKIELSFQTGSSATDCNALLAML